MERLFSPAGPHRILLSFRKTPRNADCFAQNVLLLLHLVNFSLQRSSLSTRAPGKPSLIQLGLSGALIPLFMPTLTLSSLSVGAPRIQSVLCLFPPLDGDNLEGWAWCSSSLQA